MSLVIENLTVESFVTSGFSQDADAIGGDSVAPYCIVYVSDCVSCM
ncbi:MAG TPA: hypothetical protein VLK84_10595 [Longimicrobium sp.]|nr:hypothetical protein [Longimicrobium sp.]